MSNNHSMVTRSKSINIDVSNDDDSILSEMDDVDENGNIKDFIDYDMEEDDNFKEELKQQLYLLSNKSPLYKKSKVIKKDKKDKKDKNINNMFIDYLILKATDKANSTLKKNRKNKRKKKIKIEEKDINNVEVQVEDLEDQVEDQVEDLEEDQVEDLEDIDLDLDLNPDEEEITDGEITDEETTDEDIIINLESESVESKSIVSDSESEDEYLFEYDELDEKYEELLDEHSMINTEENDIKYFHFLEKDKKEKLIEDSQKIYEINGLQIPLRFKVIHSEMDIKTKAIAIGNLDKMSDMDISSGEYSKMDHWINGLIKIPFGKFQHLPVLPSSSFEEKREFINMTHDKLDKAIYGHKEAKTHILQVIGKWIKNPDSGGNVLAIQGPMGNGKTTLVKDGISKVLNRPFAFIALGGASDSAYFDGHSYTYEGSHWGRIVQILQESKCMNPIIYFDELDKISETSKGDEIIHMLTHLTDPSQNSLFQDNYFPGIDLDLSKVLFIFSYNDESRVNKILKDRMYVINTKGFKTDDKLKISRNYLLPELLKLFDFQEDEIIFEDEILKDIIEKYTGKEEGVRNLKRCLETIVSKINIYMLSYSDENNTIVDNLSFKLEDFKFPLVLRNKDVQSLLNIVNTDNPPEHMYM